MSRKYLQCDFVSRVLVCLRFARNKFEMKFAEIKEEILDRVSMIRHETHDEFTIVLPQHEEQLAE